MSVVHACLADEIRRAAPGDQFDCPRCRAVLLESFRGPAQTPPLGVLLPRPLERPVYDLDPEAQPVPADAHEHAAWHMVTPNAAGPGGVWAAGCSCGWSKSGVYLLSDSRSAYERLAQGCADRHMREVRRQGEDGRGD